jgi:hypothetical protein
VAWLAHLKEWGYVVIANATSMSERIADEARRSLVEEAAEMKRPAHGLMPDLAQSARLWPVRREEGVK